jgi:crossover junction endodeoxyribonuclease RuvC
LTGTLHRPVLIAAGEIVVSERLAFESRLARLQVELNDILEKHRPTEAAVESPFLGVSARSALQLAHARGALLAALGAASIPVSEYAPATIKKSVTGQGNADKAQVQMMAARLTRGLAVGKSADLADAVAAALCHLTGAPSARSGRPVRRRTDAQAVR